MIFVHYFPPGATTAAPLPQKKLCIAAMAASRQSSFVNESFDECTKKCWLEGHSSAAVKKATFEKLG